MLKSKMKQIRSDAITENFLVSFHAREEMANDKYLLSDVIDGLLNGEILEDYPKHKRGACCLVNGVTESGRPIHIVCTTEKSPMAIITVYEPKPPKFETPTKRRQ